MTAKKEMIQAQEAMAAVLDAKLHAMPEWQAFRAINRAIFALETEQAGVPKPEPKPAPKNESKPVHKFGFPTPYVTLALRVIDERAQPITTGALMEYVGKHRKLDPDPEKAKINVTSSLSKDMRIRSIPWEGGRAWWHKDKPIPQKQTAAQ